VPDPGSDTLDPLRSDRIGGRNDANDLTILMEWSGHLRHFAHRFHLRLGTSALAGDPDPYPRVGLFGHCWQQ
jgi:hypothetical protein